MKKQPRGHLKFETEISWFVLVSALDVFMTYLILRFSAEGATRATLIEGNPIARWVIHQWGNTGMVFFKFSMVAVVVVIAEVVGNANPRLARLLLLTGTLVVGGVVFYSLLLLIRNW